jgi:hypothetical protein
MTHPMHLTHPMNMTYPIDMTHPIRMTHTPDTSHDAPPQVAGYVLGVIDFGDLCVSALVSEPVNTAVYAMNTAVHDRQQQGGVPEVSQVMQVGATILVS